MDVEADVPHAAMKRSLLLVLILVAWPLNASQLLQGKVIKIADGDTFTLLTASKQQVKVRLAEIDTPERGQPYSRRATQALSELVFQKDVRVEVQTTDRYGRTRYIRDAEFKKVIDSAPDYIIDLLAVAYLTGLKQGDLRNLKKAMILPDGVYIEESKTGKRRIIA
jgi:integrase